MNKDITETLYRNNNFTDFQLSSVFNSSES